MQEIAVTTTRTTNGTDITIMVKGATRSLKTTFEGFGYWYNKNAQAFQTPLCKASVMRLQEIIKAGYPLQWDSRIVEEFAKVLTL
jgi:hypothetical protein